MPSNPNYLQNPDLQNPIKQEVAPQPKKDDLSDILNRINLNMHNEDNTTEDSARKTLDDLIKINPDSEKKGTQEVILDREKNIKVKLGVPRETATEADSWNNPPGTEYIVVPTEAHIFTVDDLTVSDKEHQSTHINNVNVLMAHGIQVDGIWKFLNGGDVSATVYAYNTYAVEHNLQPVEFLIVCNKSEPDPMGIKVGEFDAAQNIAYAVGEDVHIQWGGLSKVENGRVTLDTYVDDTFFGLDQLIQQKQVESQIKVGENSLE